MPWKWPWKPPDLRLQIVDCRFEGYAAEGFTYLIILSQREAATPQMALKKSTSTGVIFPRARPNIPLLASIGKMMKNITREGARLYNRPRLITERRSIGSKNINPHIPPQTMRG
jgi:hypothetical protein